MCNVQRSSGCVRSILSSEIVSDENWDKSMARKMSKDIQLNYKLKKKCHIVYGPLFGHSVVGEFKYMAFSLIESHVKRTLAQMKMLVILWTMDCNAQIKYWKCKNNGRIFQVNNDALVFVSQFWCMCRLVFFLVENKTNKLDRLFVQWNEFHTRFIVHSLVKKTTTTIIHTLPFAIPYCTPYTPVHRCLLLFFNSNHLSIPTCIQPVQWRMNGVLCARSHCTEYSLGRYIRVFSLISLRDN